MIDLYFLNTLATVNVHNYANAWNFNILLLQAILTPGPRVLMSKGGFKRNKSYRYFKNKVA